MLTHHLGFRMISVKRILGHKISLSEQLIWERDTTFARLDSENLRKYLELVFTLDASSNETDTVVASIL